jgi:hypothetical protein
MENRCFFIVGSKPGTHADFKCQLEGPLLIGLVAACFGSVISLFMYRILKAIIFGDFQYFPQDGGQSLFYGRGGVGSDFTIKR